MTTPGDGLRWAEKLVEDGATVLHLETGLVGKCVELVEPGPRAGAGGEPRGAWAVAFDDGSTLTAEGDDREACFLRLPENASRFYVVLVSALASSLKEAARLARGLGLTKELATQLMVSAIEAQVRALRRVSTRAETPTEPAPPAPSSPA